MLQQTLVMAVRVLVKNWLYTLLSIVSLSLGLTVFLTDLALVEQARTMDQELTHHDRLYNFYSHWSRLDVPVQVMTSSHTADRLRSRFPQLDQVTRLIPYAEFVVESKHIREYEQIILADPNFFQVFDYPFVDGDPHTALSEPDSVILSRAAAARYFGDGPAIGEIITVNDERALRVTAIIDNLPPTSHFRSAFGNFNVITSAADLEKSQPDKFPFRGWGMDTTITFAIVPPELSYADLQQGLSDLVQDEWPETYWDILEIRARPLDNLLDDILRVGDASLTDVVFVLGVIVLVTACVNFTNLLIAQNTGRAKEVALRKAVGSSRSAIVAQFLAEGLMISLAALVIAVGLVFLILNSIDNERFPIGIAVLMDTVGVLWLLLLGPFVTLIGGVYPAIKVSAARPHQVFGGESKPGRQFGFLRTGIVATQFILAITLLVGTVVVWLQQSHLRGLDLRYAQDQILVIDKLGYEKLRDRLPLLKQQLQRTEGVVAVAASNQVPSEQRYTNEMVIEPGDGPDDFHMLSNLEVDPDFFDIYDVEIVAGRLLTSENYNDVVRLGQDFADVALLNVVLNQKAVARMGWESANAALGKAIVVLSPEAPDRRSQMVVVGVVEDAQIRHNSGQIDPMLFRAAESYVTKVSVKLSVEDVESTVTRIDEAWDDVYPEFPIQRQFLDEKFDAAYMEAQRNKWILLFSCVFALVISALGLFGLAGYVTEARTKEIGVRKVMGATVSRIVKQLLWDFSKPVLLANLIAWPLAYLAMRSYLDSYADRIDLSPLFFIGSGLSALLIAWLVVAAHVIRAARTHPANALRYE